MSVQTRTLTQSRRLGNSRRWGSAYRTGRHSQAHQGSTPPRTGTTGTSMVIDLSRHRGPARP